MTDLPFGRGGSPLQNLIVRGKKETVISAIRCVKQLDAGPIYLKEPLSLEGSASDILDRASLIIGAMIERMMEECMVPMEQQGSPVFFERRSRADGNLWHLKTAAEIFDYIRMLDADNYPKAFIEIDNFRLEFSSAAHADGDVEAHVKFRRLDK